MLPILFSSDYFTLYSYPLFMGLAWGVGYYFSQYLFNKNHIDQRPLLKLFFGVFVFAWLGAKVFFLAVSSGKDLEKYIASDYFWLGGGFIFYGGLLFALAFYLTYSLVLKKFSFEHTKYLAPGLAFGHAIGRIGCFMTGCCFGSQCDLLWAVPHEGQWVHPVQLYEAIILFALGFKALNWIKNDKTNFFVITQYLLLYSASRFILEFFRGDQVRGLWHEFSTSQYISILIFMIIVFIKFKWKNNKKRTRAF